MFSNNTVYHNHPNIFIVPKDACVRQSMEFLLFLELTQTRKEKTLHLGDSIIRP